MSQNTNTQKENSPKAFEINKKSPEYTKAMNDVDKASKRLKLKKDEIHGVKLAVEEIFKKSIV